ncbi:MAG TPA: GMC family oxidoreductase, partial [Thermomicrobiales bacterium]|nr:GMC family oxidoreductase [Thermomicrobiales bacterium]
GNRDKAGWRVLGHPGVWLDNTAEENLSPEPVTKGGVIQSLADVGQALAQLDTGPATHELDPQRGALPPAEHADVVLVGVGAVGGIIAPILCAAGLRVVGLEAGPWRPTSDFRPDELGESYYCRSELGPKFAQEIPRWRRSPNEPTRELTFSLGRMMNGVGGSVVHYGGWLRRYHPHHFRARSRAIERWGERSIPDGCTLVDWPVSFDELEPYFARIERIVGIARDDRNPLVPMSDEAPLPPARPFRMGELFRAATEGMGLHPHPAPIGMTTRPYHGFPEMRYTAWNNGFGSWTGDKWHPGLTSVPEALATGNFDLRTHCRVTRVLADGEGRARGVEYVDAAGNQREQRADAVILAAYTFENVRLLFLSGDARHPDGLGNNTGQLGKHFMAKMFAHVDGYFPDMVFNRHTGPAAQGMVLDDFLTDEFESFAHGFLGGATLGAENQFLPIQISREALPADVPRWGAGYRDHIRQWQHFGVVRMQPEALPHQANCLDLDPRHRDRSGLDLPVIRVTYDLQENERRLGDFMETKAEAILRTMGATKTWRGPRFTGAGSSHDVGGARM